MRRETPGRRIPSLFAALTLAAVAMFPGMVTPVAGTQSRCDVLLTEARAHYEGGKFNQAVAAVDKCLEEGKPSKTEQVQALGLQAKVHLALDEVELADRAMRAMLRINPDYEPDEVFDPPSFVSGVREKQQESTEVRISSVSKTSESLREAPATVTVLTAEQIERRGYLDLEALLHDLPGFDISRSNGQFYSNVYQRGFRSDLTERTLVLVDGVEENNLWTSAVYLSRQYPLVNVERVEVIYGPASTMYGANAFAGVINIVTKDPEDLLPGKADGAAVKRPNFALRADVTAGSFDTRYVDLMMAGRTAAETLSWSLTARLYQSDEDDLSRFPEWDFDPAFYDSFDYATKLSLTQQEARDQFVANIGDADCTGQTGCFYRVTDTAVQLTPAGAAEAARRDKDALSKMLPDGRGSGFEDPTDDWLIHGKLKMANLVVGFQTWRRDEGWSSWRTDFRGFGTQNWIPEQTWLYLNYSRSLSDNLTLSLFSRYKEHELDGGSEEIFSFNYARFPARNLQRLVAGEETPITQNFFFLNNSQFRNEIKLVYTPTAEFNLVAGFDSKNSSLQGLIVRSAGVENPAENGSPQGQVFGGDNRLSVRDLGFYAQASYRPTKKLKLVAGGRVDHNEVRDTLGYGTVFNPRLAVVYSPGDFVFKAIYAEAFQDVSVFNKYNSTNSGSILPNPGLDPEEVKSFEVSANWRPNDRFSLEVSVYDSKYSGVALLGQVPCFDPAPDDGNNPCANRDFSLRFDNAGALEIRGIQADADLKLDEWTFFGNYTFTDPFNETDGKRVGDIASHQLNLGLRRGFLGDKLDLSLRANYVGDRKTGPDTSISDNSNDQIDAYLALHTSLTYKNALPGLNIQIIVNNLTDEEYFHPGIRAPTGAELPSRFPQPGRTAYLRLSTSF